MQAQPHLSFSIIAFMYIIIYVHIYLPYSGLFSLGANFFEFYEWVHYSGKLILGCCMKLDCGSPLQKLAQMQLCPDGLYTFKPKATGSSKQQTTYFSLQLQPK